MSEFKKMKLSEARAKFEQIDELKGSTYKSYIRKSQDDLERHTKDARKAAAFDDGEYRDRSKFTKTPKDIYQNREAKKRVKGLDKAYKLVNKKFAKEEAELSEMDKSPESPKFNPARLGPGGAPAKPIPVKKAYKDMADIANSTFAKARADAKSLKKEETEGCMLDTSMGGADQIATSKTGEIYKKSTKQSTGPSPATGTSTHVVAGKGGEAYNTAGITKRVPAVESAALGVFEKTLEKRRIFEDASNIAIISPDQRQDWLNVSAGRMDVVDYFNKYRV